MLVCAFPVQYYSSFLAKKPYLQCRILTLNEAQACNKSTEELFMSRFKALKLQLIVSGSGSNK